MRRLALLTLAVLLIAGCSKLTSVTPVAVFEERDYQWHKHTTTIKVHWNYLRPEPGAIVAEGFVEPFKPDLGVFNVRLELVGLGLDGNVVNSESGTTSDNMIASPYDKSYFRIQMKLNGEEKRFTVRGRYHYYMLGTKPTYSSKFLQYIPLEANEPY